MWCGGTRARTVRVPIRLLRRWGTMAQVCQRSRRAARPSLLVAGFGRPVGNKNREETLRRARPIARCIRRAGASDNGANFARHTHSQCWAMGTAGSPPGVRLVALLFLGASIGSAAPAHTNDGLRLRNMSWSIRIGHCFETAGAVFL
jgi:hypothetical protein